MHQPLVSVIIPVYNMEKYIERCITNLRQQTYSNLELIIVDDGSQDKTAEICRVLCNEEKRIKFFSKTNEGVSAARNYALEKATGDYVTFVDADDVITQNHIEHLVKMIDSGDADLAITEHNEVNDNEIIDIKAGNEQTSLCEKLTRKEFIERLYDEDKYRGYLWNKIFKMSIINEYDIKMPDGINIFEDMVFIYRYSLHIEKVCYGHLITYYYVQHSSSAMKNINQEKFLQSIEAREEIIEIEVEDDISFIAETKEKYVTLTIGYIKGKMIKANFYDKNLLKKMIRKSLQYRKDLKMSYKYYIQLILLRYFTGVLKIIF